MAISHLPNQGIRQGSPQTLKKPVLFAPLEMKTGKQTRRAALELWLCGMCLQQGAKCGFVLVVVSLNICHCICVEFPNELEMFMLPSSFTVVYHQLDIMKVNMKVLSWAWNG